jgi:site-specific recombinase XerD
MQHIQRDPKRPKHIEPYFLITGKGSKDRIVPLHAGAIAALKNYLAVRESFIPKHLDSKWLFPDFSKTGDKREILDKLMQERYPVYALADYVVDSSDGPHERVVERVIAALGAEGTRS